MCKVCCWHYLFYVCFILCTGHEFRVVILSVVRTHYSIDKDLTNKCGFYTEKQVLNTAFARVQSLIITAAHPLSLITRGHMSCRLFWASYLSQTLTDEECDQLRKEFVSQCQVNQNSEVYSILIKNQISIPNSEEYRDQILDDLAKQFDAEETRKVSYSTSTTTTSTSAPDNVEFTLSSSYNLNSTNSTTVSFMTKKTIHRPFIPGLHSSYINSFSPGDLYTVAIIKGAESGYALVLNPSKRDIWLPDSSALNRSLRGDTIVIDKLTEKRGNVIANISDHPKKYFVCYSDRHARNLFIPIDRQYPKIDISDLSIIKNQDIEKNVYLVWLNSSWSENYVYPMGKLRKLLSVESDSNLSLSGTSYKSLSKSMNILKYSYIPAMLTNNGKHEQKFPEDWEIPDEERRKRKFYKDVFTIDDIETVVLDDALSLKCDQNGNYIVSVHIADASYFVKPGSALDRVASKRGRTFYINYEDDRAMFMLPDNLCMEHGSLNPGKERLAVTTQFVFSKEDYSLLSQLSDVEVHRSIVHSVYRLTKEVAGRFLLDESMTRLKDMNTTMFSKMKKGLSVLGKIATKLRKSQWADSYLYEPDRGKQDKYTMAGSSLVEMFMCLCNTAIPAKLLKRDGRVGPVLVHTAIKHHKQHEWLEKHYHLLECCPLLKRMISIEVIESFNHDRQNSMNVESFGGTPSMKDVLAITQECWDKICDLTERSDGNSLATYLCSLYNFPELFVAYRQLCECQSKSFYDIITNPAQASEYKHSHFNKIYTHFTSPLRRYCDLLVHRAVLGETSLPTASNKIRQLMHTMNIHKWDEREFSRQRNMLCVTKCCRKEAKAIAVTVNVIKVTNKLMELHASPEHQDFLLDRICEVKLSHLQAEGDKKDKSLMKWQVDIIPAPGKVLRKDDFAIKKYLDIVEIPLDILAKTIEAFHYKSFKETKINQLIKLCKANNLKCKDVEQKNAQHSRTLIITKWIREYSKLDIQLSFTQEKYYAIEPTISLIHISQTYSRCLLHVKHPIECYAQSILRSSPVQLLTSKTISDYVSSWWPAVTAESITNSITSRRIPLIIKDLWLEWTSNCKAQFIITNYEDYKIKYQQPFSVEDYVCIQYRDLLPNPNSEDFQLDNNKKVTWVVHGRITKDLHEKIEITFPENTIPPKVLFSKCNNLSTSHLPISHKLCDLEIIPIQITFR